MSSFNNTRILLRLVRKYNHVLLTYRVFNVVKMLKTKSTFIRENDRVDRVVNLIIVVRGQITRDLEELL